MIGLQKGTGPNPGTFECSEFKLLLHYAARCLIEELPTSINRCCCRAGALGWEVPRLVKLFHQELQSGAFSCSWLPC